MTNNEDKTAFLNDGEVLTGQEAILSLTHLDETTQTVVCPDCDTEIPGIPVDAVRVDCECGSKFMLLDLVEG